MQDNMNSSVVTRTDETRMAWAPFLAASVLGSLLLLMMKYFGLNQWWVSSVAVIIIVVYAVCGRVLKGVRLREDQLGDNCYYLGFIYTLMSLCYALYVFSGVGDGIDELISSFGVALISTIAGVVARVTLNQMRRDMKDYEHEYRRELHSAVLNLRSRITQATDELSLFCTTTRQTASEAIEKTAAESAVALSEGVGRIGDSSRLVLESIQQAFEESKKHSESLNVSAAQTVKALKGLVTKIEKIDAPSDLVSRRLEPALIAADKAAARLSERLEADQEMLGVATKTFADIEKSMTQAAGDIQAMAMELRPVIAAAQGISTAFKEATDIQKGASRDILEHQQKFMEESSKSMTALTEALKAHNWGMAEELARARRLVADTGNALAELSEALSSRIETARPVASSTNNDLTAS